MGHWFFLVVMEKNCGNQDTEKRRGEQGKGEENAK